MMKPDYFNYTSDPYPECNVPTSLAATEAFAFMGNFGTLSLEVAKTANGITDVVWNLKRHSGNIALPCFIQHTPLKLETFTPPQVIIPFNAFRHNGAAYILLPQEPDLHIRRIHIYGSQDMTPLFQIYNDSKWHIVEVYIQERKRHVVSYCWYEEAEPGNKLGEINDRLHPMFLEDILLFNAYSSYNEELKVKFLDPGDRFFHHDILWQVNENEKHELFIFNSAPHLKIQARSEDSGALLW